MNETITLPKLISFVAQATDCTPAEARKFVHDFFALIEQTLSEGEMVTIKGVGTFARTDNPAAPVKFQADDELAAAINEPFSAFQAVELNDGVTEDMLQEQQQAPAAEPASQPEPEPEEEPEEAPMAEEETPAAELDQLDQSEPEEAPAEPEEVTEEAPAAEPEEEPAPEPEEEPEPAPQIPTQVQQKPQPTFSVPSLAEDEEEVVADTTDDEDSDEQGPSHRSLWFVLGLLLGLIAGLIGGYIAGRNAVDTSSDDIDRIMAEVDSLRQVGVVDTVAAAPEVTDTVASAPAQAETPKPTAEEVYDTVRSGYYLTTMAGKHYGHKNYWVFIYQANPGLGNPNTIGPGTRVKIPPIESFAEPTEEATKAKAQQILNELHSKYNI